MVGDDLPTLGVRFLSDTLRLAPGLEVQRMSSTESGVSVRGYNDDSSASQGILGLLDGRQVYNEFFGGVVWEMLPVTLEDIEQVEVLRGPGSFLHGPNAMHGLVAIRTRSPLQYKDEEVRTWSSYGSYRSSTAGALYVRREPTMGFKGKVVWDDLSGFDPRDRNAKDKSFLELRYETLLGGSQDHRLDITGGASQQKVNILIPSFGGLPAAQFANDTLEGFVRVNHTYQELKTQVSWTRFESVSLPDQIFAPFEVILDTLDADMQFSKRFFESHTVTVGTGHRVAAFETEDLDVSEGRHDTGLSWAFVQDEIEIQKELWLTLGFRVDRHSVTGSNVSPRLAAVWKFAAGGEDRGKDEDRGHYLRASAGSGFRNPSLRELWFNMPVGPATIRGNKDLEAEQMRSFELGYWGQPRGDFRMRANVYYNLVDRLVNFLQDPAAPPGTFRPQNDDKEDAYGAELELEQQFRDDLHGFANYSYGIRRDRDTHRRNPAAPRHKANAGLRKTFNEERITAVLWATFFDDVEFVDPAGGGAIGAVDAYTLLNARISWRPPLGDGRSHVFLQAFNLLDHDHREHPEGDSYGLILMGGVELVW